MLLYPRSERRFAEGYTSVVGSASPPFPRKFNGTPISWNSGDAMGVKANGSMDQLCQELRILHLENIPRSI